MNLVLSMVWPVQLVQVAKLQQERALLNALQTQAVKNGNIVILQVMENVKQILVQILFLAQMLMPVQLMVVHCVT